MNTVREDNVTKQPRSEYPRPQFQRKEWLSLNGEWDFSFDSDIFDRKIIVPYAYQWKASGIGDRTSHQTIWYRKKFIPEQSWQDKKVLLHVGACDYLTEIWLNDHYIGEHLGGHSSFTFELKEIQLGTENTLVFRVEDYPEDLHLPRGKQYWKDYSEGIFYTPTSGIWQSVWLEPVNEVHIKDIILTPDVESFSININTELSMATFEKDFYIYSEINYLGIGGKDTVPEFIARDKYEVTRRFCNRSVQLSDSKGNGRDRYWSPENPRLFGVTVELFHGEECIDKVETYFGMRSVSIRNGKFCLNGRPYTQRLVLDQGYFPQSGLTAPTDDDLKNDILLAKAMGFNGARKHQKVEDPRWLFWADRLGFFVWGEMANAYSYSIQYANRMMQEWTQVIKRDYNHPSIVCWVPINESWGTPQVHVSEEQQAHAQAMYFITKSLDTTRLVLSNDGWEHTKSDLLTIHDYTADRAILEKTYSNLENILSHYTAEHAMLVGGFPYSQQPILVTEFGGISYQAEDGWGYSAANSEDDFLEKLRAVFEPLQESTYVQGFCYTQLTDVEQEKNGLLKYDRTPKVDLNKIKEIIAK